MIYTILFTGHMIDKEKREHPRFPAAKENAVREAMRQEFLKESTFANAAIKGIASGACGGDILFHELCVEYNIKTHIYLAMPAAEFKEASVSFARKNWEERFNELLNKIPVTILPDGMNENNSENVWERTNMWMLNKSLEHGGENMSLIALWDGENGDGNGGTAHMINIAKKQGARINIIDIKKI